MNQFNSSSRIEYEDLIPAKYNRWGNDALLFRVNKGSGKLFTRFGVDRNGKTYRFLLLDHQPLINCYGEELYCPTCAKILSIGLGRESVDQSVLETIRYAQETGDDITTDFERVKPVLSLLEDGYYLLTRIEMIPTDGEQNFFWNLSPSKKRYHATADVYDQSHYCSGTPKFLLPSQRIGCLNEERVQHYIEQIKKGKTMTGLAIYYDGFMSTLLDGHHRATAAYIENKNIDCLTIIDVTGYSLREDQKPEKIYAGGEEYALNMFRNPARIYTYLEHVFDSRPSKLDVQEVENILHDCQHAWENHAAPKVLDVDRRVYPDYLSIADEYLNNR